MTKWLVDYKTRLYNKEVIIPQLDGYICSNPECGEEIISENAKPYIDNALIKEKISIINEENIKRLFISNIKNIRLMRDLSQKQIGSMLGVTEQRYGAIERNSNTPTITTIYSLADILDVKVDELYKMIYVTNEFYQKIIHLELIVNEKNPMDFRFRYAKDVKAQRDLVDKLRNDINELNMKKRSHRLDFNRGVITKDEFDQISLEIDKDKRKIENIKNGKHGEESKLTKLESKYNLVVKQGDLIDDDDWSKIKKVFKDEIVDIF